LGNFTYDGVFVVVQTASTPLPYAGPSTNTGGFVGTAAWGPFNTPIPFSLNSSMYDQLGQTIADSHSIVAAASIAAGAVPASSAGANLQGVAIRVGDGTQSAAVLPVIDAVSGSPLFNLEGLYPGSRLNGATAVITSGVTSTNSRPVYNLTITTPQAPSPEIFAGIEAYANNAYSAPTFIANAIAAVTNGIAGVRGPSKYWVGATVGSPSSAHPAVNTSMTVATPGTDGVSAITSALLEGVDSSSFNGRTGGYALRGTKVRAVQYVGNTDFTTGPNIGVLAQEENWVVCGPSFPVGTAINPEANVTTKQNANVTSQWVYPVQDWVSWQDPNLGITRVFDPASEAMGVLLSQNPEQSIGNKPYAGLPNILGTERSLANQPYSSTEKSLLTQAGIGYITGLVRNASLLGFAHGQSAASGLVPYRDGLNWADLTNYLVKGVFVICGPFVDELQGDSPDDVTRAGLTAALNKWFAGLLAANRIGAFKVTNDLTVNTPVTIAQGYMLPSILVQYLGTARFIIPTLQAGADVQIVTGPATNF
jgi:hypothetical protein